MASLLFHYYCLVLILLAGFWVLLVVPSQYFVGYTVIVTGNAASSSSSSSPSSFVTIYSGSRPRPTGVVLDPNKLADSSARLVNPAEPAPAAKYLADNTANHLVNPAIKGAENLVNPADLEKLEDSQEDSANAVARSANPENPVDLVGSAKAAENLVNLADLEKLEDLEDSANEANLARTNNSEELVKLANLTNPVDLVNPVKGAENSVNLADSEKLEISEDLANMAHSVNPENLAKSENSEELVDLVNPAKGAENSVNPADSEKLENPENPTKSENSEELVNLVNPVNPVDSVSRAKVGNSVNLADSEKLENLEDSAIAAAHSVTLDLNLAKTENLEELVKLANPANPMDSEDLGNLGNSANPVNLANSEDSGKCDGKWIYLYELPPEFNSDLVRRCRFGITLWMDLCAELANDGLGKVLSEPFLGEGWFHTDSYTLEVIFHYRMRQYPCRTSDPNIANAFFVPYYTGIDALPYLYSYKGSPVAIKDLPPHGGKLAEWLKRSPHWRRFGGCDHFLVMGRTSWDFDRFGNEKFQWGTGFSRLPEIRNMTALLIEKKPWMPNEQAIPYPTSFHPTRSQLDAWKSSVLSSPRRFLFAFAGSIRQTMMGGGKGMIRELLLRQCNESAKCCLIDCKQLKCNRNPAPIIDSFLHSDFCLQPRGDTPTRRSTFDSLISGCIPVFFHRDSAYTQYTWHLPVNSSEWSVFIPEEGIKNESLKVEEVLLSYSKEKIKVMREKSISLIPRLVYSRPTIGAGGGQEWFPDAFDTSIQGVLSRIESRKEELRSAPM